MCKEKQDGNSFFYLLCNTHHACIFNIMPNDDVAKINYSLLARIS